jgi:serine/threonine-protein kinase RsbW
MPAAFRERFDIPSSRDELDAAIAKIVAALEQLGYDQANAFAIRLALEEALTNAMRHGNKSDPNRIVKLACDISERDVVLDVEDQGEGFDPHSVPDPTAAENVDIPSGRGLMLMRSFMAEVQVHPPGNRVTMRYHRS